ncbi:MAG: endo-1,4-beta-xylanase [Treponema sp.]|nr:endo-1,4-beta-xylanase [Treponema sp.]
MNKINERKAEKVISVMKDGRVLADTELRLRQTNHEFLFGCGAFDFVGRAKLELDDNPNPAVLAKYREITEKWLKVFNYGTLPFYWGRFEIEEGQPQTNNRMAAAKFLKAHDKEVKGHPLCWHTVCADWLLKYDNKTILEKQLGRIQREVEGFKGVIDKWDVINEVVIMPVFDRYDNAITRLCKELGQVGIVKTMFDQCVKYNPEGTFLINDFNMSEKYAELIERCLDAGVRIDTIGLQSHQHQGYWGREKLEEVLARFERFGLPIHFTENTLVSGPLIPEHIVDLNDWHYNDDDSKPEFEERQKDQMIEMIRILFEEHPLVKAHTSWDFMDGMWLNAPSGVLRRDGSEKPVYHALDNLINKEYHTEENVKTDGNGNVKVAGFKGKYVLETLSGEKVMDLTL